MNKNTRLFVAGLFIAQCTFAQNVGIGTTSPAFPLEVRTSESGTIMRLRTAKDSVGAITLLRFTTGANLVALGDKSSFIGNITSGGGNNLIFGSSANGQNSSEKMRLNYLGHLGIGTTDPTARLFIDMSNTTDDNALTINDDEDPLVELRRNNVELGFWQLTGNDVRIGTTQNNNTGNMILRTNGSDRLVVSANGAIRMGLLNDYNIQVGFATGGELQAYFNGSPAALVLQKTGGKVEVGNFFDFANTKLQVNNGVDVGLGSANSGYLMLGVSNSTNLVADNNEIQARNNSAASTLFLQNGGGNLRIGNGTFSTTTEVGITGNAHITSSLQIGTRATPAGFNLSVDGKIICTEVMVKLNAWPDYVFDETYRLPTISQLEQFIQKHKHLPGIPSATEMSANPAGMGEIQRLHMEKIEELSLYIIQLKKEIDRLNHRLNSIQQ